MGVSPKSSGGNPFYTFFFKGPFGAVQRARSKAAGLPPPLQERGRGALQQPSRLVNLHPLGSLLFTLQGPIYLKEPPDVGGDPLKWGFLKIKSVPARDNLTFRPRTINLNPKI